VEVLSITPQVFDLLECLIRSRERVVTKDDLISAVWNGRIVSDAALTTRLNAARTAIGDSGEKQRLIKTLARKGFRFVGAVQEAQTVVIEPVGSVARSGETTPTPLPPRLSIVVLPFTKPQRRPRARVLRRWGDREPHHRLVAHHWRVRDCAQHRVHVQG
jgi:DNA-binding winged helix-turn-helix (wHTH) protein